MLQSNAMPFDASTIAHREEQHADEAPAPADDAIFVTASFDQNEEKRLRFSYDITIAATARENAGDKITRRERRLIFTIFFAAYLCDESIARAA